MTLQIYRISRHYYVARTHAGACYHYLMDERCCSGGGSPIINSNACDGAILVSSDHAIGIRFPPSPAVLFRTILAVTEFRTAEDWLRNLPPWVDEDDGGWLCSVNEGAVAD